VCGVVFIPPRLSWLENDSMVILIPVLCEATDNFSSKNILGQGFFGVVYRGELHDGTRIVLKRRRPPALVLPRCQTRDI